MTMADDTDYDNADAEWVLNTAPLKLREHHIEALKLKFGENAALDRVQERTLHALGRVRIDTPYNSVRRR